MAREPLIKEEWDDIEKTSRRSQLTEVLPKNILKTMTFNTYILPPRERHLPHVKIAMEVPFQYRESFIELLTSPAHINNKALNKA